MKLIILKGTLKLIRIQECKLPISLSLSVMHFTLIKTLLRPINNPFSRSLNKVYPSLNQCSFDFFFVPHSLNNRTFTQTVVKEILIYLEIEFVLRSGAWVTSCTHILLLL